MSDTTKKGVWSEPSAMGFIVSSVVFFVITVLVGVLVSLKFIWPEFMGTAPWLTFGRMRPLHVNGVLFGWLLAADIGVLFYMVPRLCGNKLWSEKLGLATLLLFDLIILAAVFTTLGGYTQGLEYAELPFVLDVGVTLAWVMFGVNIFATIATRKHEKLYVSLWYTMGAVIWTAFVWITGNFATELFTGINQANLNWFFVHNAVGLIFTPLGVAIAYYFIPKSAQAPLYSHKLSMIGFWSIAFIYVWTGAHHMIHGPISQWLQTVAILFSVMLIIPVWTVIVNFFGTVAGRWDVVKQEPILKFLMTGTTFYLLTCFQGPMHSLRTVSAIVSKTDWVVGHAHMAVLGAFSSFAMAGVLFAVPEMAGRKLHSKKLANQAFWLFLTGGLIYYVSLWVGGFIQGLQWNDTAIPFIDTVKSMRPYWIARSFSGLLILTAVGLFLYNIVRTLGRQGDGAAEAPSADVTPAAAS
ncbi:MAG: cbb3-type cytochrome c oxidase subunit I [Deltaproteobacteria bacterium]|nr:cbb3-type cytochrome c oxidase subunit I [Deltaproteobacteria bacterium]